MSAYTKDPRVIDVGGRGVLFRVTCSPGDGPTARVRRSINGDMWVVWPDDQDAKGGWRPEGTLAEWREFTSADEAIASLIGAPQ